MGVRTFDILHRARHTEEVDVHAKKLFIDDMQAAFRRNL